VSEAMKDMEESEVMRAVSSTKHIFIVVFKYSPLSRSHELLLPSQIP